AVVSVVGAPTPVGCANAGSHDGRGLRMDGTPGRCQGEEGRGQDSTPCHEGLHGIRRSRSYCPSGVPYASDTELCTYKSSVSRKSLLARLSEPRVPMWIAGPHHDEPAGRVCGNAGSPAG